MELNTTENDNLRILSDLTSIEVIFSKQTAPINVTTAISITLVNMSGCISYTILQPHILFIHVLICVFICLF